MTLVSPSIFLSPVLSLMVWYSCSRVFRPGIPFLPRYLAFPPLMGSPRPNASVERRSQSLKGISIMVRSGGAMTSPEKHLFASSRWAAVVVYRGLIWTRARVPYVEGRGCRPRLPRSRVMHLLGPFPVPVVEGCVVDEEICPSGDIGDSALDRPCITRVTNLPARGGAAPSHPRAGSQPPALPG